ncbi:MAG: phosphoadenylyl-sulfate reductase [Woeseiaceae bacterium]|nr:phosphoadenylyl-sulfate reductase [Woeseiaceae bacterium]
MNELGPERSRGAARTFCESTLAAMTAEDRIAWALETLPGQHIVSSSFGAQSALMLHLVTRAKPGIPVVLIDTGYLFPETYQYIDQLTEQLSLNLKVFSSSRSPAWQEAREGRRWEQGVDGISAYNHENKVQPMERALQELDVSTWFAGLRRSQSSSRGRTPLIESSGEQWKVHPVVDWSDRDVYRYMKQHRLPYHPLWEKGFVSIGDTHTTRSLNDVSSTEELRFFGLTRECGLHEMSFGKSGS